ncbi:deoxyguanosinetriphosphate triphosphohydrolase [Ancylobacter defluvii]|uniref:Deoxyguanosinetriphosphate triphosphohydrolase-like protein n=1 Tax=Ancylobacter defluvii TaxID=1282440 RepID=A0A9W6JUV3_9HYPH|nr:deoxyguanosinetriphosphate triphosphohydrolase [Ancylobacter defluvii]MBS7587900.1 deoxyguanosinetriphosphate triphosphohydrolase [Ancylobacter defluvii]GLK83582.1 deoxyguanosinetriphosphate triphosphohydrolase-like protein [Ancylobacter defluvii]
MALAAAEPRADWAARAEESRGRLVAEPPGGSRSAFRRDADRIIHSSAFRRLAYKTQVFTYHEGDHYRTRLTHTLEVVQVARSIARALGLDEDLAEALALAHDLGHPPFAHAGERVLHACMASYGGFDHNAQSLRVVTRLENRYPGFDGLNLSWETLEGIVKHNGPLTGPGCKPLPHAIAEHVETQDLWLGSWPSAEAQVAAIADDIAYDVHDLDDGLRAGMFTVEELAALPLVGEVIAGIAADWPGLVGSRLVHEVGRRMITLLIDDAVAETRRRAAELAPASADDVRRLGRALVGFSPERAVGERAIKDFLFPRMYRHPRVMSEMDAAGRVVRDLFGGYMADSFTLPVEWRAGMDGRTEEERARRIADFIAGQTDRYALAEHARLFDSANL